MNAFLFDLDGVLVDTAVFHYQAWRRMANSLGFDFTHEFNETLKGISRMDSLDRILALGGVTFSDEKKQELAAQKNEWYLELISQMTPDDILPGALAFLEQTRRAGLKVALGSVSKNAPQILEHVCITHFFDAIIDGSKITRSKPDPEVFLKGAAELNVPAAGCIVFEDAVAGIEAAKRAGMFAVGIGSPDVLTEADLVVPNLERLTIPELLAAVDRANGLGY